jgi:hypothetical protein
MSVYKRFGKFARLNFPNDAPPVPAREGAP